MQQSDEKFFEIARSLARKSTCLKNQTAVVIVKGNIVVGRAWNLCSPNGYQHGEPVSRCPRMGLPTGQRYDLCKSLHAELLALLNAGRENCEGATLYLTGHSYLCWECESLARVYGISETKLDPAWKESSVMRSEHG